MRNPRLDPWKRSLPALSIVLLPLASWYGLLPVEDPPAPSLSFYHKKGLTLFPDPGDFDARPRGAKVDLDADQKAEKDR